MIIRCYGARGSIPVSGKGYHRYGGDTTCIEIRTKDDDVIILDAGSGIRRLGKNLIHEERFDYHLLFTHSHWDHILGFPFFRPIFDERVVINLMGCPTTQGNIRKLISRTMSAPFFPVPFDDIRADIRYADECQIRFQVKGLDVTPINLSHPNEGMGYKFEEDGRTFVFLTDNELGFIHRGGRAFEDYVAFCRGADFLVHDAEYTRDEYRLTRSWGHSTYTDALALALQADVKVFAMFHHNQDREDDALDAIVASCRDALQTKNREMTMFAMKQDQEWRL
jgi:phosphoribosyl 1,2-cyclic phosphodiesterase